MSVSGPTSPKVAAAADGQEAAAKEGISGGAAVVQVPVSEEWVRTELSRPDGGFVEILEPPVPARTRRPLDAARLTIALLATALVVVIAVTAERTVAGLEGDITEASGLLPSWVTDPLELLSALAVVGLWVGLVGRAIVRREHREAIELATAWALGLAVVGLLAWLLEGGVISDELATAFRPLTPGGSVLDSGLAATVAMVSLVGWSDRPWVQRGALLGVLGGAAAEVLAGTTTIQGALISILLGRLIGLGIRLVSGVPTVRATGHQIAEQVVARDVPLDTLEAVGGSWPRYYRASANGRELSVVVLDRDQQGAGALGRGWRWLRLRGEVLPQEAVTMRAATSQRALAAHAMHEAGVRVPEVFAVLPVGTEATVFVERPAPTETLDTLVPPSPEHDEGREDHADDGTSPPQQRSAHEEQRIDQVLDDLWNQVVLMHAHSLAHRRLSAESIRLDEHRQVWLTDTAGAEIAASPLALQADVAQVLVSTAAVAGTDAAVAAAVRALGAPAVARALPLVQPLALTSATRSALRGKGQLLEELREAVLEEAPAVDTSEIRIERVRPKMLLSGLAMVVAVSLVAGQLAGVDVLGVLRDADPAWVLVALLAFFTTYLGASWGLLGFVPDPVPLGRVVATQISLSFVRLLAPSTIGASAFNLRMLLKSGVAPAAAATSVAASQAAAALVGVPLVLVLAIGTGSKVDLGIRPSTVLVTVGVVVAAAAVVLTLVPAVRRRAVTAWEAFLRRGLPRLLDALQDPRKLAKGLGGNILLTFGYGISLWASVQALGGQIAIATAVLVYLSGNAVGSIVPTPGGLGAVEAAMVAGLGAAGVGGGIAVSAVLVFRLITFWLPIPLGWFFFNRLQRSGVL